jgi:hypothetical protein
MFTAYKIFLHVENGTVERFRLDLPIVLDQKLFVFMDLGYTQLNLSGY